MKTPYVNLAAQWADEREQLLPIIDEILATGFHIGGPEVEKFEHNISKLLGVRHAVALSSGTDALFMALHLLGVGKRDEVITPPNSFIASTAVITHLGAKPVFVDVAEDQNIDPNEVERAITEKTKAIMPVHLTGRICDMHSIVNISERYNIPIVEDAAQAMGSKYRNKYAGSFGDIGCFSAHPLKNLNAFGDAGFLTTNISEIAQSAKVKRNHGLVDRDTVENFGYVSRMDNLQAGILNYHLDNLDNVILKRRKNAKIYQNLLSRKYIFLPEETQEQFNTYHTFVIQLDERDALKKYLNDHGVETAVHYPIPIHLQPASQYLNYSKGRLPFAEKQAERVLTLPVHQYLSDNIIEKIAHLINKFFS